MSSRNIDTYLLTIQVKDVTTGTQVNDFKFIVNENNVGNPFDPDPNNWPSLKPGASHSPVVATGDSTLPAVEVPGGNYLISVLAPGYKLGGLHVNVTSSATAIVSLQPDPLPLSKIRVHVFHDNSPVNGEDDIPLESGLPGFRIVIGDIVGEVTTDYFGNIIGTQYQKDSEGKIIFGPDGKPVPVSNTGGIIWTDGNGDAVIDNLAPGKYEVQAIPPDGTDWIQTTTIEGTHVIDAWIEEGNDGYSPREGFKAPLVWFGFVRPMEFPAPAPGETTGTITTRVRTTIEFVPPTKPLTLGDPVDRPWVALTDIGRTDKQVYTGRGDTNGSITITNVPAGVYQMAVWDEPLDYIISFRTVQMPDPETGSWNISLSDDPDRYPGQIGIPRWYGWIAGKVFRDVNGNGIFDSGEEGIPNVEVGTRFKDGSVQYSTVTDMEGNYALNEVFELERFNVSEVGFTRFGRTTATATADYDNPDQKPTVVYDGDLTLAALTWAAKKNKIDWGKKEYPLPGPDGVTGTADDITNGGISGIVYYATMRNELDPRFSLPEDYEPGIPNVAVNLYATETDPVTGEITRGPKINSVATDAWEHPLNPDGTPVREVPGTGNYLARGVFDGGYAFEPLPEGTYIVEVEVPPGYKPIDESSVNTGEGDTFIPSENVTAQMLPPPYEGSSRTAKIVTLGWGLNAAADFFLYTDVPVPGRIVGFLLDDVNIETDPARIYYGEKRGIPHAPVGIRDYKGRLITTVYSDPNGIFEVVLPSTYTANIPSPSGVAPGMYQVIGNDPGDPDTPNEHFNPNYQTLKLVFDVWPGKTTYADVALFPITAFVETPGSQFSQPPLCRVKAGTPQITSVNRVYLTPAGSRTLVIEGKDFGNSIGFVTLNDRFLPISRWRNNRVTCAVPRSFSSGAWQLLLYRTDGRVTPTGLTIHVLGTNYNPPVANVPAGGSIQAAIDSAPDRSLIIVPAGTYYESPILYKNVKIQGYGPEVTKIDGRFFLSYLDRWENTLNSITFDGPQEIPRGQVITVVAQSGAFSRVFHTQIDGFYITGARGEEGGGLYANAYCSYLEISNNIIQSNGGGFGGAVTLGRAYAGSNYNDHVRIYHNRILNNGGISLAGAIGIFNGAHYYEIDHNEICGNYSAEYGGGISHYGLSRYGRIHHNCVSFNASFDEGAGIFIGGEQPIPPAVLSAGSGEVRVYNNCIQGNVANDDGGGIRLLQPGRYRIRIYNNMIVNNVSTDLGGGIALDDASNVIISNNTIAKNITTATAEDSDGRPHAAGLASEPNSAAFQASLPPGSPVFSNPVLFNNLFWDNRAHYFDLNTGKLSTGYMVIDLEVFGTPAPQFMTPNYSYLSVPYGSGVHNIVYKGKNPPRFIREYNTRVDAVAFTTEPRFISVKIVTVTPEAEGNYHLRANSPAVNTGTRTFTARGLVWAAPPFDFDDDPRPWKRYDIGADEYWPVPLPYPVRRIFDIVEEMLRRRGIRFPARFIGRIPRLMGHRPGTYPKVY
ncbi:MAG: pectin esterase [Firmicutes bacterium HGW-Firmicutes-14]|nr:MAG: pectin esterase [Firmicutes bacterium HGW-Firmicutes-14]